jgi:hypothetical protein
MTRRGEACLARHRLLHQAKARFQRPDVGQVCPTYKPRNLGSTECDPFIVRSPLIPFLDPYSYFLRAVRSICPVLGGRGTSLAKRSLDDHAHSGGAGAPPSQRPDYFRIDPEME